MIKNFLRILFMLILIGCQNNELEEVNFNNENVIFKSRPADKQEQENTVVIRFKKGLSDSEKAVVREKYNVLTFEVCSCGDPELENWFFSGNLTFADLEEKVLSMESDTDMEGADLNFKVTIDVSGISKPNVNAQREVSVGNFKRNTSDKIDVVIGVLDSGINPSYFQFTKPFLFDSTGMTDTCGNEIFGWNFVNNNNSPIDDSGHGTRVSYFIYEQLINSPKNFQILPAKVFDVNGSSSLFTINCGFSYLIKRKVNVINMSFGWKNNPSSVMKSYINEIEKYILINASAGNLGENNDVVPHYPSSYKNNNILAVTAIDNTIPPNLVLGNISLSNYGENSVDIGVKGLGIPFYTSSNNGPIFISGTSYSSAKASGFNASLYKTGLSINEWYHKILQHSIPSSNLNLIKHSAYLEL